MKTITCEELKKLKDSGEKIYILDVRDEEDYEKSHIPGAVCMPMNEVTSSIEDVVEDIDSPICVYCYSGNRSGKVCGLLEFMDYTNVYNLGGFDNWKYEVE